MSEADILEDSRGIASGITNLAVGGNGETGRWGDSSNLLLCLQYLPMDYLLKTEPTVYSFADLEREKTTIWDGVTNPTAVKHLREMKPGERLVIYHTGDEKSAVGTATVVTVDASDPRNPQVKIKVGKAIAKPKTLAEIKARAAFAESPLVRQGRLSVVPLSAAQYGWLVGE
jgi:predicted RNA-binding protein with PUA-like domain